ncbi:aspartate aminotransferase family protein [Helicobacter sp. 16-1353]|uniref:aspartate aminotransferase family protein n=1 Tax=Helicobacter sp. 16-1353 TaxID=2004996 RepID=UPI000DCBCF48|nr:aspartate aminotransferase family protein [Helicobacter sp. 16-1353]RAX53166.1 aspartate aminotransferase family protein [Helicobacter sp. 16-1353]
MKQDLEQMDKDFVLHTYARDYTHFVRGKGAKIYDERGTEYIDFTAGIGVNSLGHNHPKLVESIASQAKNLIHTSNLYLIEPQARLAKKLSEISGYKMRTFFSNSGLEANECAIKIARKYGEHENRFEIITLKNSFHGRSIATLKACGQDKMHTHFAPFPNGFIYAENIVNAIEIAKNRKSVVAILLELIQGEGGIYAMPRDEVAKLREWTQENDVLLMIDEVQSGVYRSGEFLCANAYGVTPDVVSLAKGLAGGVPIGATMTNKIDVFEPSEHGSTFGGNFLSTSAGLCVLEVLEAYQKSGELSENIAFFEEHLRELQAKYERIFLGISGLGLMRGMQTPSDEILGQIIKAAKKEDVLLLKSGKSTLRFLPPITISKEEIKEGFERLTKALDSIKI